MGLCGRSLLWTWIGCLSPALGLCAGQPATDPVAHSQRIQVWAPSRGFRCAHPRRCFLSVCPGSLAAYQGARPSGVSGVGPQATDWGTHPLGHFGSGAQAAGPLIRACAHLEFQLWAPSRLIWLRNSWTSGEHWDCFSGFTVQGRRGQGRQRLRLLMRVL